MKIFGAGIRCEVCSAQPYPDDPSIRETFSLTKVADAWYCEEHVPSKRERVARAATATPAEALDAFEAALGTENGRFQEALVGDHADLAAAFKAYVDKVRRALAEVKNAFTPQKPPASPDDAPKGRRSPKKITKTERRGEGQQDWVAGAAPAASEGAP